MLRGLISAKVLPTWIWIRKWPKCQLPSAGAWVYGPQGATYITFLYSRVWLPEYGTRSDTQKHLLWHNERASRALFVAPGCPVPCAGVRICQHRPSTRERPCGWRTVRSKVQRARPGRVRYCGIESAHRARPSARLQLLEHKHCRHLRLQSLPAAVNQWGCLRLDLVTVFLNTRGLADYWRNFLSALVSYIELEYWRYQP